MKKQTVNLYTTEIPVTDPFPMTKTSVHILSEKEQSNIFYSHKDNNDFYLYKHFSNSFEKINKIILSPNTEDEKTIMASDIKTGEELLALFNSEQGDKLVKVVTEKTAPYFINTKYDRFHYDNSVYTFYNETRYKLTLEQKDDSFHVRTFKKGMTMRNGTCTDLFRNELVSFDFKSGFVRTYNKHGDMQQTRQYYDEMFPHSFDCFDDELLELIGRKLKEAREDYDKKTYDFVPKTEYDIYAFNAAPDFPLFLKLKYCFLNKSFIYDGNKESVIKEVSKILNLDYDSEMENRLNQSITALYFAAAAKEIGFKNYYAIFEIFKDFKNFDNTSNLTKFKNIDSYSNVSVFKNALGLLLKYRTEEEILEGLSKSDKKFYANTWNIIGALEDRNILNGEIIDRMFYNRLNEHAAAIAKTIIREKLLEPIKGLTPVKTSKNNIETYIIPSEKISDTVKLLEHETYYTSVKEAPDDIIAVRYKDAIFFNYIEYDQFSGTRINSRFTNMPSMIITDEMYKTLDQFEKEKRAEYEKNKKKEEENKTATISTPSTEPDEELPFY